MVSTAIIAFIMVPAKKMENDMTNEELIQPPSSYPSFSVGLKYKEFEIATVKILAGDHGTGVPESNGTSNCKIEEITDE